MKLLWLYDDLLDLYGDRGNPAALEYRLAEAGLEPVWDKKSVGDEIDFTQYSLVYIGPGLFSNLAVAAADLLNRREAVLAAINSGTPFLVIGNAPAMFMEGFTDAEGQFHQGLGLFAQKMSEGKKIIIHDIVMTEKGQSAPLCGFFNSTASVEGEVEDYLFDIKTADGKPDLRAEGQHINNFYGSSLLGPLLVRNPSLLHRFVDLAAGKSVEFDDGLEVTARDLIMNELGGKK